MKVHEATEQAYKNGYAKGYEDGTPKWISVSERLPEYGSNVLAFCSNGSVELRSYFGFFEKALRVKLNKIVLAEVTHWMPLPQPPAEVDNGR